LLREYEFTVISRADVPEGETAKILSRYETLMTADGGAIVKKDDLGVRRFTYPINKHFKGNYTFYDYVGTPANLSEVERLMRIDENVLRYMSVRLGENVDVEVRRAQLAKKATEAQNRDDDQGDDR